MLVARWWTKLVDKVWDHLVLDEPPLRRQRKEAPETDIEKAVAKARDEWLAARAYFDSVTDPELIDHAIYAIEAAERKYMYLLRHAEEFGYQIPKDPGSTLKLEELPSQGGRAQPAEA
jgi:hypothetical protein